MKDELSEATVNFPLQYLYRYISTDENTRDNKCEIDNNFEYMVNITKYDFNTVFVAYIDDFYFGMWSCFEAAINSITAKYEKEIYEELKNINFKKYKNFLKNSILKTL